MSRVFILYVTCSPLSFLLAAALSAAVSGIDAPVRDGKAAS